MNSLADFQQDMRRGYLWGATGIMTSGLVWLAAGLVAYFNDPRTAIWVLFIGAGCIVPVSNLFDRTLGAPGTHSPGNRLSVLALETTVCMLMCLPLAYGLALYRIEWFFPAVLMVIGGRYITFGTIYGTPIYWLLGAVLGIGAVLAFVQAAPPHVSALLGAAIELVFGAALLGFKRREAQPRATPAASPAPHGTEFARPFLPSRDFELSKRFYEAVGFEKLLDSRDVAIFRAGSGGFLLQRRYQKEWAENCMMQLMVDDLDEWWAHILSLDLPGRFHVQPPKSPAVQPWGLRVAYLVDPCGVLWHVAQRRAGVVHD